MSTVEVNCGECGHVASISSDSDAWKCNCVAGVSEDPDCVCDAANESPGTEDNPPDTEAVEINELEHRLAVLRGGTSPTGELA